MTCTLLVILLTLFIIALAVLQRQPKSEDYQNPWDYTAKVMSYLQSPDKNKQCDAAYQQFLLTNSDEDYSKLMSCMSSQRYFIKQLTGLFQPN